MNFLFIIGILGILSGFSYGLLARDAFDQELIRYSINPSNYQLSCGYLIGNINDEQFGKLDINNDLQVQWSIDLDKLPIGVDNVHISHQTVFVYENNILLLIDSKSGIIINKFDIDGTIKNVIDFFNKGALIQIDNTVVFIDNMGQMIDLINFDHEISTIFLNEIDGFGLLLINHQLYQISYDLNIVSTQEFHEIPISFTHGMIITKSHRIFIWNGQTFDLIKSDIPLTYFETIDSTHLLAVSNEAILLYSITDGELVNSHQVPINTVSSSFLTIHHGLSTYLVIIDEKLKHVYDLTDYLILNDADSIKHIKSPVLGGDYELINDDLQLVTFDSNSLNVNKISLVDGSSIKGSNKHPHSFSSHSIIIEFPESRENIEMVNTLLEDSDHGFIILRWLHRVKRHLSELGRYTYSLLAREQPFFGFDKKKEYGFEKILVFYDSSNLKVTAIDTISGEQLWATTVVGFKDIFEYNQKIVVATETQLLLIDPKRGSVMNAVFETAPVLLVTGVTKVDQDSSATELRSNLAVKKGNSYTLSDFDKVSSVEDIYFVTTTDNVVNGNKIPANKTESHTTWTFKKSNEQIIKVNGKASTHMTASIGIPLASKSVLYKYLNPNTVTIITKDSKNSLNLYVIDGITGNLILKENHTTESIDFDSVHIVHDDNWIVYSYFVDSINFEQRINVIDLFDSKKAAAPNNELVSVFNANVTLNSYSKKSFIYPERINSLSSTQSKYGITLKSIIIATKSGSLVEIPKYILNSRRIDDRELTQNDAMDDYRMSPYSPVIPRNTQATLNHKFKLSTENGVILTKPTDFESTSVVCFINKLNCFCTLVQPSSSFDLLSTSFNKYKLLVTISVILLAYFVSKPFVAEKKLKAEWIDVS